MLRIHLGSVVQQGYSAQYIILVKFFPPSLPLETMLGFVLCYCMPSNKLGTLLGGAVKSAQRLPPSLLTALLFNTACKPIFLSDPARAVLHSARNAGEITRGDKWSSLVTPSPEVAQANLAQGSAPPLTPICHYLLYKLVTSRLTCIVKEQRH